MRRNFKSVVVFAIGSLAAMVSAASCAQSEALVAREAPEEDASSNGGLVTPTTDAGDADTSISKPLLLCMGTECPAPFATCTNASASAYKCGTDLDNDVQNCGSCGHLCASVPQLNVTSATCSHGKCIPFCDLTTRDCNQLIEDGCETYVNTDHDNCGKCGNKCADGVKCISGNCGCPPGQTECNGVCVDTKNDDANCGACANICWPPDGKAPPPNMYFGCADSQCEKPRCIQNNQVQWTDCNNDIDPDGCEVDLKKLDPNNCGGCGITCTGGEICEKYQEGRFACACPAGQQRCDSPWGPSCKDFSSDGDNCGGCGQICPFKGAAGKPHQTATCNDGVCGVLCDPGFADCNSNAMDGCETNLMTHGGNCGACGNTCDTAAGQPCVNGACLMVECSDGETK